MGYFPFFINLTGKICVVIGDGKVAERKAASLRMFDGEVSVYAKGEWNEQVLSQAFLVVAATDQREVNRQIALFCREKGIFVNVADSKEESTVLFPAVIRQGPVSIGISTGGFNRWKQSACFQRDQKVDRGKSAAGYWGNCRIYAENPQYCNKAADT